MTRTESSSISTAVSQPEPRTDLLARFGIALIVLGVAMAANSVLGPLLLDTIDYPVSPSMRNQTIGLDAATLFVIAPLTVLVGWLALSGHRCWRPYAVALRAVLLDVGNEPAGCRRCPN